METVKAPGLKWRKLASGLAPIWVADEADVRSGYSPKTINLKAYAHDADMLVAKCNQLQADMLLWRTGHRRDPLKFDGTVRALLDRYELHPRSPYRKLRPGSLRPYNHYLRNLRGHIGSVQISTISGVDIFEWHEVWSENGKHLAAAAMARAVLEAANSFGILLRTPGCIDLGSVLREASRKLPKPRSRRMAVTADQVATLRKAAHAHGAPSRALAYAVAFETTLRLWDVIGQWWPIDREGLSPVVDTERGMKWFGLRWEDIDADLILRAIPSKTSTTTEARIAYPLSKAPMVLEELKFWPEEKRQGPMIVSESSGVPYAYRNFTHGFKRDRKAAGLPASLWARDLRASGITEGRATDVSLDDTRKVAGHSSKETTAKIYDRAVLEAADRFAAARIRGRETKR